MIIRGCDPYVITGLNSFLISCICNWILSCFLFFLLLLLQLLLNKQDIKGHEPPFHEPIINSQNTYFSKSMNPLPSSR